MICNYKIINDDTKEILIAVGDEKDWFIAEGFALEGEIEEGFNGKYYLKGYAPKKPAPTEAELLPAAKQQKLAEISQWTAANITGGFVSSASGEPVRYDSDLETQITMQGIALNVNTEQFAEKYSIGCPVRGYKDGEKEKTIQYLSASQVLQWLADLSIHIGDCKQEGWKKQSEVEACKTVFELNNIEL